jgi:uncharacterized protein with PhoU and TrkA domain
MSVAGVKEPRLKAITTIIPAISDISKSAMDFSNLKKKSKKLKQLMKKIIVIFYI